MGLGYLENNAVQGTNGGKLKEIIKGKAVCKETKPNYNKQIDP